MPGKPHSHSPDLATRAKYKESRMLRASDLKGEHAVPGVFVGVPRETIHLRDVIGNDDRIAVEEATSYPARTHAHLEMTTSEGKTFFGTGWFISPRTVITAGHCVFDREARAFMASVRVTPGASAAVQAPYGTFVSADMVTTAGWHDNLDQRVDYGAILLPDSIGNTLGWLGYTALSDEALLHQVATIAGYAFSRDHVLLRGQGIVTETFPYRLAYTTDTTGGQSGSPVSVPTAPAFNAVGIHTEGGVQQNLATRITPDVVARLDGWRR